MNQEKKYFSTLGSIFEKNFFIKKYRNRTDIRNVFFPRISDAIDLYGTIKSARFGPI